jgi:hypothetical protein
MLTANCNPNTEVESKIRALGAIEKQKLKEPQIIRHTIL